jgi:hypothetical protein
VVFEDLRVRPASKPAHHAAPAGRVEGYGAAHQAELVQAPEKISQKLAKNDKKMQQAKNSLFLAVGSVGSDHFLDSISRGQFEPLADEPFKNIPSVRTVSFYPIGCRQNNF